MTHADGLLSLRLRRDLRGRTVVAERAQRFPLRMTVPMYLDDGDPGMAFVYVQNPTGAIFAGDELEVRVVVDAGARAHVTTQSATKVARMDGGRAAQQVWFDVGAGGYLEYLPDAVIPQAGAHLEQTVRVELGDGAAFVTAETLGPGRRPLGERFAYERLCFRTEVHRGDRSLLVDTLELAPGRLRPDAAGVLGSHAYVGTLLAVAPEADAAALADLLHATVLDRPGVTGGASVLPNDAGVAARILTSSGPLARRVLLDAWGAARQQLIGVAPPALRK